ncbi:MAG: hypothetical protein QOF76_3548 [Solirubrobacteraceae bacterium]|jgi:GAF domain-containing protein|nr:hypothetical protein [Solirubrobacteraceae bacterium]
MTTLLGAARADARDEHEEGYADVLGAYQEIAEAAASSSLDAVLALVARRACTLLDVSRSSVFLREPESDFFRARAKHPAIGTPDITHMVCGGAADGFTREILATQQPVFIHNARRDTRPVRSAMLRFAVRDMLGVPILSHGEVVGLLFLDIAGQEHPYTPEELEHVTNFASLVAIVISQVEQSAGIGAAVETLKSNVVMLRRVAAVGEHFARLSESCPGAVEIAELTSKLTEKPCSIYTADHELLAHISPTGSEGNAARMLDTCMAHDPEIAAAIAALELGGSGIIGPDRRCDLLHRHLVSPVAVDGTVWGHIAIMEWGHRLTRLDKAVAEHAARTLGQELRVERRAAATARVRDQRGIAHELLTGGLEVGARGRHASLHGVRGDAPRVVCLVRSRASTAVPAEFAATFARHYGPAKTLVAECEDACVALMVEVGATVACDNRVAAVRAAVEATIWEVDTTLVGAISAVADTVEDLQRAYAETQRVMGCLVGLCPTTTSTLTTHDLGVGRLLLGASDSATMNRFVDDTMGPLLDEPKYADLLTTLHIFLDAGRSPRCAANRLAVHENTVRYRLARITELTGVDVASDADAQLIGQVAVLILRLQGRLPGFDVLGRSLDAAEPSPPADPPTPAGLLQNARARYNDQRLAFSTRVSPGVM